MAGVEVGLGWVGRGRRSGGGGCWGGFGSGRRGPVVYLVGALETFFAKYDLYHHVDLLCILCIL